MRNKSVRAESTHNTWIMRILFERKTGTLITYILIKFSISFIISGKLETIWFVQSRLCIFTTYSNIQTIFILKDRLERFAAKGPNSQDFIEPQGTRTLENCRWWKFYCTRIRYFKCIRYEIFLRWKFYISFILSFP